MSYDSHHHVAGQQATMDEGGWLWYGPSGGGHSNTVCFQVSKVDVGEGEESTTEQNNPTQIFINGNI